MLHCAGSPMFSWAKEWWWAERLKGQGLEEEHGMQLLGAWPHFETLMETIKHWHTSVRFALNSSQASWRCERVDSKQTRPRQKEAAGVTTERLWSSRNEVAEPQWRRLTPDWCCQETAGSVARVWWCPPRRWITLKLLSARDGSVVYNSSTWGVQVGGSQVHKFEANLDHETRTVPPSQNNGVSGGTGHTLIGPWLQTPAWKKVNKIETGELRVWLVAEHLQDPGFPSQNLRNK